MLDCKGAETRGEGAGHGQMEQGERWEGQGKEGDSERGGGLGEDKQISLSTRPWLCAHRAQGFLQLTMAPSKTQTHPPVVVRGSRRQFSASSSGRAPRRRLCSLVSLKTSAGQRWDKKSLKPLARISRQHPKGHRRLCSTSLSTKSNAFTP